MEAAESVSSATVPEGSPEGMRASLQAAGFADIAVTYGQQRLIKTWHVGHNELPGEAGAGLAPEAKP